MQYDVDTPQEYLSGLEDDWRRTTLLSIRDLVLKAAPEFKESIRYKMLSFDDGNEGVFALNAQKGYVSFYALHSDEIDPTGELLKGLDCGKSCIRFTKSVNVPSTKIGEFITRAVDLHRRSSP